MGGGLTCLQALVTGELLALPLSLSSPDSSGLPPQSLPLPVPSLLLQLGLDWRKRRVNHLSLTPSPCLLRALQARAEALWAAGGAHLGEPPRGTAFSQSPTAGPSFTALLSAAPTRFLFPFLGCLVRGSLRPVSLTDMFSAWDRRERPPEEGAAAGLQGFGVDKTFLSSLKGILLETELVTAASPTWCLHLSCPSSLAQAWAGLLGWPPRLTISQAPS